MITFKSTQGLEIIIPIAVILIGVSVIMVLDHAYGGLLLIVAVAAFVTHMFRSTEYTVSGNELNIKCGFLVNRTIKISSITRITETYNPISSPATSLDRLAINYEKYGLVLISPEDKIAFLKTILAINPTIEVRLR